MIRFFVQRPVLTNLLFLFFLSVGILAYLRLPMEAFPEMNFGTVMVTTLWPGHTPSDIESQITIPIEEKISEVDHILDLDSYSTWGMSQIRVKFNEELRNEDYEKLLVDVQNKIREIRKLPIDVEQPVAILIKTQDWLPVLGVAISGNVDEKTLKHSARLLKDEIKQIQGVARVKIGGLRDDRIEIKFDPQKLYQLHLDPVKAASLLFEGLSNLSAGVLEIQNGSYLVRTRNEPKDTEKIRNLVLKGDFFGGQLRLGDVAEVTLSFEEAVSYHKRLGDPALILQIQKTEEQNALILVPKIKDKIKSFLKNLPSGIEISYFGDTTTNISRRLSVLKNSLSIGMFLVFLILWLFIGFKNSFLAMIGIPFSFLAGFAFMHWYGITINEISIFSLVIVSGMVVDDAIVILENIVSHHERGKDLLLSAIDGAQEVLWPVTSSTLTTISAFLPMVIMTGEMGRIMILIPIVVSFLLAASFLEAFWMLPCHFAELTRIESFFISKKTESRVSLFWKKAEKILEKILRSLLRFPLISTLGFLFILAFASTLPYTIRGYGPQYILFPTDTTQIWVTIECPSDYSLEQSAITITPLEKKIADFMQPWMLNMTTNVGSAMDESYRYVRASNLAQITIDLKSEIEKLKPVEEIVNEIRVLYKKEKFPEIKNMSAMRVKDGPPTGKPVAKRLSASSLDLLHEPTKKIMGLMQTKPELINIETDLREGAQELDFILNEEKIRQFGLNREQVSRAISMCVDGIPGARTYWGLEEVEIRASFQKIDSKEKILETVIQASSGEWIHLSQVVSIENKRGFSRLIRYKERPAITIYANLSETSRKTAQEINAELDREIQPILTSFPGVFVSEGAGEVEQSNKSLRSLMEAFLIAFFLMYMILATQFNSYWQPILILLAIPFAFFGVYFGMGIMDQPFTMLAFIAMVGLAGVVVNDTIVLIDFINQNSRTMPIFEAVIFCAKSRLRAIFLTSATTVAGLFPTLIGIGGKSIVWQPMATCVCFGITTATLLTLFLVPGLYLVSENIKKKIQKHLFICCNRNI